MGEEITVEKIKKAGIYLSVAGGPMQELCTRAVTELSMEEESSNKEEFLNENPECTFSFKTPKNQIRQLEKVLGVQRITKKRAKKLLMSKGYQRNKASIMSTYMYPRTLGRVQQFPSLIES